MSSASQWLSNTRLAGCAGPTGPHGASGATGPTGPAGPSSGLIYYFHSFVGNPNANPEINDVGNQGPPNPPPGPPQSTLYMSETVFPGDGATSPVNDGYHTTIDGSVGSAPFLLGYFRTLVGVPGVAILPRGHWSFSVYIESYDVSLNLPIDAYVYAEIWVNVAGVDTLIASNDTTPIKVSGTDTDDTPYSFNISLPTDTTLTTPGSDYIFVKFYAGGPSGETTSLAPDQVVEFWSDGDTPSNVITTFPGQSGQTGASGPTGPSGPTGATGPVGPPGAPGQQGVTGPQGLTGPVGPVGPQGQQGATGPQAMGPTWGFSFDSATYIDPGTGQVGQAINNGTNQPGGFPNGTFVCWNGPQYIPAAYPGTNLTLSFPPGEAQWTTPVSGIYLISLSIYGYLYGSNNSFEIGLNINGTGTINPPLVIQYPGEGAKNLLSSVTWMGSLTVGDTIIVAGGYSNPTDGNFQATLGQWTIQLVG